MLDLASRNATLADAVAMLNLQQEAKRDAVVPAEAIRSVGGTLLVRGMGPNGPDGEPAMLQPTAIMDGQIAEKLGIPTAYLRRLRTERPDLLDANVNGWLQGIPNDDQPLDPVVAPDSRSFLIRSFTDPDGGLGVGRALLSPSYSAIDNLDMTTAVFAGIREAGFGPEDLEIRGCDVTEQRMVVKIAAPQIAAMAPALLAGYRSPFSGAEGADNPTVFAGLVFTNSETGGGAYSVIPRLEVQVCTNGMVIKKDAMREVHLGSRLEEGVVRWSRETGQRSLDLIAAKTRDAVVTYLDADYVQAQIRLLEAKAGQPVTDAVKAVELVSSALRFSEEVRAGVLDHFIKGGQTTRGGLFQAVTSYAQVVDDPDVAWDLELSALSVLDLAAA